MTPESKTKTQRARSLWLQGCTVLLFSQEGSRYHKASINFSIKNIKQNKQARSKHYNTWCAFLKGTKNLLGPKSFVLCAKLFFVDFERYDIYLFGEES